MVIVQAGHQRTQDNCYSDLRGQTGAPGEIDWTPGIVAAVCAKLMNAGVTAQAVDANFNCDPNHVKDFEAFVAVHYQSDPPNESGFYCGPMDPAQDGVPARSRALANAIASAYQSATGLQPRPNWDSINIEHYYLFEVLSSQTPVALIECGTGAPGAPDHAFLWGYEDQVVDGIFAGIMAFLGKPIPAPAPAPAPAPTPQPAPAPTPPPLTYAATAAGSVIAGPDVDLQKVLNGAEAWLTVNRGSGAIVRDSTGALVQVLAPIPVPPAPAPPPAPEDLVQKALDALEKVGGQATAALENLQPLLQLASQIESMRAQLVDELGKVAGDVQRAIDMQGQLQPLLQLSTPLQSLITRVEQLLGIAPPPSSGV